MMRGKSIGWTLRCLAAVMFAGGAFAEPVVASEYRIAIGDVLELSVWSVPEFRHRSTVGVDGQVSFPLVGDVQAAHRTLAELRKVVKEIIPRKNVRRRALDGSEHETVIGPEEIALLIAEYSPIYIGGDVSRPGSYAYRPTLTVGQAISLAGGYDVVRSRIENPYWLAPEARSQQEELSTELVRDKARMARIQAELDGSTTLGIAPAASPLASSIQALEADQLSARLADVEKERKHLNDVARSLSTRLDLLQKQSKTEHDRSKIDQDELDRVQMLFDKAMVPITRLSEVKRLLLFSASRATEIESRAEETRTQLEVTERRVQRLDDERRIVLLKELQDVQLKLANTQTRLDAWNERMFYLGALRSKIGRGATSTVDFVIVRRGGARPERIAATQDSELLPNDLVEVTLKIDLSGGSQGGNPVAPSSSAPAPQTFMKRTPEGDLMRGNAGEMRPDGRDGTSPHRELAPL